MLLDTRGGMTHWIVGCSAVHAGSGFGVAARSHVDTLPAASLKLARASASITTISFKNRTHRI
jgi:hypothetical protein